MQDKITESNPKGAPKSKSSPLQKWSKRIAVTVLSLWIIMMLLIQIPAIQKYLLTFVTDYVSAQTGREVSVDGFQFYLFDKISLENVYIQGDQRDTMLSAGSLVITFDNPIYNYIRYRTLTVEQIELDHAALHIKMDPSSELTNLEKFIKAFESSNNDDDKEDTKRAAINFDLQQLITHHTSFTRVDSIAGTNQIFSVAHLSIQPQDIDIDEKMYIIEKAIIDSLSVDISNFTPIRMSNDTSQADAVSSQKPLLLQVRDFDLSDGTFILNNYTKSLHRTVANDMIDWAHFAVRQIEIDAEDFNLYNWNFDGCLHHLSGNMDSGFELSDLRGTYVHVDTQEVHIEGGKIQTPFSSWSGDVKLTYDAFPAFKNFVNEVNLDVSNELGYIAIKDIIDFAPKLNEVEFFRENQHKSIELRGWVHGDINHLKGDQIFLNIGGESMLKGSFRSKNLANDSPAEMNLEVVFSETNMNSLQSIIPGFNPPANFYNLGTMNFTGQFDGLFKNFVASGQLATEIGNANMNMNMDLRNGVEEAQYSGTLNLINFDLGQWSQDPDFGLVTFNAEVPNGKGLRLEDLYTDLMAEVERFNYKEYEYTNFKMEGRVIQSTFNGDFEISDQNIELDFLGIVDLSEELPIINVEANVEKLNLYKTNLTERDLAISGKGYINIENYNLKDLQAQLNIDDLKLIENGNTTYLIDAVEAYANSRDSLNKVISIQSEIGDLEIKGNYDLIHLWPKLKNEVLDYYPALGAKMGWTYSPDNLDNQIFKASCHIEDTKNWTYFVDQKLDTISNTMLELSWDDLNDSFYLNFNTPHLAYGPHELTNGFAYLFTEEGISNAVIGSDELTISDRFTFESTTFFSDIIKDTLFWTLNSANYEQDLDQLNLHGKMFISDDYISFRLLNEGLNLFTEKWKVNPQNLVQIGKKYLHIEQLDLNHNDRDISIRSVDNKGIAARLKEIELSILNEIMVYDKLSFDGLLSASINYEQIYSAPTLFGNLKVDSFFVNGDDYGTVDIKANAPGNRKVVRLEGGIQHPDRQLNLGGYLFPTQILEHEEYYDATISLKNYPFKILEYFLNGNIENTEGTVTGDLVLSGSMREPILSGSAIINDAAVTIPFLGIRVFIDDQTVETSENFIDASGAQIKDIYGNTASIQGGLRHRYFKDLSLDLDISSDEFLLLNTTDNDSTIYYGHCLAAADVRMDGLLSSPDIYINARETKDTRFYLRTDLDGDQVNAGFFRYKEFSDSISIESDYRSDLETIKGVNFSMDLVANENAVVEIIIDKKAGDIIKGRGNGNIRFNLERSGEITMYGDYEISDGEYLFTSQDFINKTFEVADGSSIRWTGDPFGAILDIRAEYEVYTSPYLFVQELVTDPGLENELKANTQVYLAVLLTGLLYAPDLSFEFRFPQLTGQAKTTVENKLAILESDPNEMYAQAGALIVLNSFAPSNSSSGQALGFAAGVNTLSEFVSNQFSNILSGILKSAVKDVDFIDDIELQLDYNLNTNDILNGGQANTLENGELRINTTTRLFDRVELDLGGNYGTNNNNAFVGTQGTYFNGNIAIQYSLTEDRQLMMRIYSLTDQVLEGQRVRSGVGLRYQKEFDTFEEFFSGLKSSIDKGRSGPKRPQQSN